MSSLEIKESLNASANDYFMQKKIETMIDINNKKVAAEMNALRDTIKKISEELADIKSRIGSEDAESIAASQDSGNITSNVNLKSKQVNKDIKPRYGDYTPEDVAINKIFYFGKK